MSSFGSSSGSGPESRFDAVLFDVGDTLLRLTGSGVTLVHRAAEELGAGPLDPGRVEAAWRRVLARSGTSEELAKGRDLCAQQHRAVWTRLYTDCGCDALAPGLSDRLYELTIRARSWEPFPDALPTLAALHERGLPLGVVSDTGFDLRPALSQAGLLSLFDTVVLSYEQGRCKPAPAVFLAACAELGVAPARTLMVGDNASTDGGAAAAGLFVLLLPPAGEGLRGLGHVLSLVAAPVLV